MLNRGDILPRSEIFGKAFEHFIFQELIAHSHYSGIRYPIAYWRTASQLEIDFVLGDHEVAIEIKGTEQVNKNHLSGIKAFKDEYPAKKYIVVSLDPKPRIVDGINILPWELFLKKLWNNEIMEV